MKTSAREKLRQERIQQARREKRRRTLRIVVGLVAVAVVAVGVFAQVNRSTATSFSGPLATVTPQQDGTVVMAEPGVSAPVLDVYVDFQCPLCKEFERVNGGLIKQIAAEGKAKVVYHPIAFVNPEGSVRAAAAAQCVPGSSWMAFHDAVFAAQPDERTAFTVEDLKKIASDVGITDPAVTSCIESQRYAAQVRQTTASVFASPEVQGTPTLLLDGRKLTDDEVFTSTGLRAALEKASR
ncbi:DsbA family protein [Nonomuraea maritima]|uniref:DsbA family protein n=1 Tax=Nonomuraea maritima TaxID=683260 RepID=UPI00371CEE1B